MLTSLPLDIFSKDLMSFLIEIEINGKFTVWDLGQKL